MKSKKRVYVFYSRNTWTDSVSTNAPSNSFVLVGPVVGGPRAFYRVRADQ